MKKTKSKKAAAKQTLGEAVASAVPAPQVSKAENPAPQTPKGKCFLFWHLGLGDAIICNGLVRSLLDKYEKIMIPCKPRNLPSVRFMFHDQPRIEISPVTDDVDAEVRANAWRANGYELFPLGMHRKGEKFDASHWDQEFYRQAGVPFENRWKKFFVQRELDQEIKVTIPRYIFIYRDLSRGFNIDVKRLPKSIHLVEATQVNHVFKWCHAIENAEEIHAIEGGILCLIDSFKSKAKVRCFHKYARSSTPPTLSEGWMTT